MVYQIPIGVQKDNRSDSKVSKCGLDFLFITNKDFVQLMLCVQKDDKINVNHRH